MVIYRRLDENGHTDDNMSVKDAQVNALNDKMDGKIVAQKEKGKKDYKVVDSPKEITENTEKVMSAPDPKGGKN